MRSSPKLRAAVRSTRAPAGFRRALLRWYDHQARDLPWRQSRDPYRIWISEIMLQQTRVAAVLDHYRDFLQRFPDISALAAADESAVLAAWSGLGYYRRARMLHRCAQRIVAEFGNLFPETAAALRVLPGIGRYTAAAIASIAFGESVAVVDGNVERVLERVSGEKLKPAETWDRAQALLDHARPGDFNQSMMELGATTCTPRQPSCQSCPVRLWCATRGELAANRPIAAQQKKEVWCALQLHRGRIRLVQRSPKASLMAGMWELPRFEPNGARPALETACWRTFRHAITVTNYTVRVVRRAPPGREGEWIPISELPQLPLTGLTRKILRDGGVI